MTEREMATAVEKTQMQSTQKPDTAALVPKCDAENFVKQQNGERQAGDKGRTHGGTSEFGVCTIDGWKPGAQQKEKQTDSATKAAEKPVPAGDSKAVAMPAPAGTDKSVAMPTPGGTDKSVAMPTPAGTDKSVTAPAPAASDKMVKVPAPPMADMIIAAPALPTVDKTQPKGGEQVTAPADSKDGRSDNAVTAKQVDDALRLKPVGDTRVLVNDKNQIAKSVGKDDRGREFTYDAEGKLATIKSEFTGSTWKREGDTWVSNDGKRWQGTFVVDKSGDLIFQKANGSTFRFTKDGDTIRKDAKGNEVTHSANGDRVVVTPDKVKVTETPNDPLVRCTAEFPDKSVVIENVDGTTDTIHPDGTRVCMSSDRSISVVLPDRSVHKGIAVGDKSEAASRVSDAQADHWELVGRALGVRKSLGMAPAEKMQPSNTRDTTEPAAEKPQPSNTSDTTKSAPDKPAEPKAVLDTHGNKITELPNGDRVIVTPSQVTIMETPNNPLIVRTTVFADGAKVIDYVGGQSNTVLPDKTETHQFADGRITVVKPDGTDVKGEDAQADISKREFLVRQARNARVNVPEPKRTAVKSTK